MDVVVVVGRGRPAVGHAAPAVTGALRRPDPLGVDDLGDAQRGRVGPCPVGDLLAGRATDHDVQGAPGRVVGRAGAVAAVGGHLGEPGADRAVCGDRIGTEAALDAGPAGARGSGQPA